jgi:hypothetical protein
MGPDSSTIERVGVELPTESHDPLWLAVLEWIWDIVLTVLPLLFLGKALFMATQPRLTIAQHWLAQQASLMGGKRRNLGEQLNALSSWGRLSFP